jgi:hypothetical protein
MQTVEEPLDELYFQWLYRQVAKAGTNRSKTHWSLLRQLFTKEFVWIVPNDDNRIVDGTDLRFEFVNYSTIEKVEAAWMYEGCSVLEMLIALSRRLAFEADGQPRDWFWVLMKNLALDEFTDTNHEANVDLVDEILNKLIWRQYHPDGRGGLFPLQNPEVDQRQVELWYQMSMWLYENLS